MANPADQIGRLIRINTSVSPELRPLVNDINNALREMDRRRSISTPDVVTDESARPSADLNEGRMIYVKGVTQEFQFSDGSTWNSIFTGGGGGTAPVNATYITITNDSTLTKERSLAVTSPITKSDAGANSAITLALDAAALGGKPALVLSTSNIEGNATTFITTNSTILAFDATTPANLSGTAATGSAEVAARRDHVHDAFDGTTPAVLATAGATGSNDFAARSDHAHEFPTALQSDTNSTTLTLTDAGANAQTLTFSGATPRLEWSATGMNLGQLSSSSTRNRMAMGRAISSNIMYALSGRVTTNGASLNFLVENTSAGDTITGLVAQTTGRGIAGFSAGNTFRAIFAQNTLRQTGHTVTAFEGIRISMDVHSTADGTSNVGTRYGSLFTANPDPAAADDYGVVTTTYAHYVEDIAFGTNRWSFYAVADDAWFGAQAFANNGREVTRYSLMGA